MSLLPHTLRVRKAPTTPRYSTSTDAGVSAFWVSTLEPCSGLCPFAYVTNVIQWRGGGGGGGGRRGVGRKGGAKQNQWGIAEYSELFFRAKNVQRRMLNCVVKKKKKNHQSISLYIRGVNTHKDTHRRECAAHTQSQTLGIRVPCFYLA